MQRPEPEEEGFEVRLKVRLRTCTEADLPALEWNGEFTHHRELIQEAFRRQERGAVLMLLAMVETWPVGQVWIDLERLRAERAGYLWALRVVPWLAGRGVGRRLLGAAERMLRARSAGAAEIHAETWNHAARRLYERLGYQVVGRVQEEYAYAPPGRPPERVAIDEWVLRKRLDGGAHVDPDGSVPAGERGGAR